jgi:hypothetical protein
MNYIVHFYNNPSLAYVKLVPENEAEKKLLSDNIEQESIELYFHNAIQKKLPEYVLLEVVVADDWPYAADIRVQKVKGIGR